jgi:DNA end-binding protein Ku
MPRPYWSGQIQISLVAFGVKLFVATEAKSDIQFHQIDRRTGERVRHQKVLASAIDRDPDEAADQTEVVQRFQIVKGYEYSKGQYVTLEPEELAQLRVPSKHTMEVTQFVDQSELPPSYFEKPYFVVPENEAQTEAYLTVRKALVDSGKIALSKIAFGGREHVVAIAPTGTDGQRDSAAFGGMMAYTMRYPAELRDPADYFRDIKKVSINADSLSLAKELIQRKSAKFDPSQFVDGYEAAVHELVEAKLKHAPIPQDEAPKKPSGKVINLMDALRKSVGSGTTTAANAHPSAKAAAKKGPVLVKSAKKPIARSTAKQTRPAPRRKSA